MANGVNHAKQIVIEEATDLAEQLQNGGAGDTQIQGKAIGLMVKMITPLYQADFVTVEVCAATRSQCNQSILDKIDEAVQKDEIRSENLLNPAGAAKTCLKLGPLELKGAVVPIAVVLAILLVPTVSVIFITGKIEGWW
jgi:hypothetical protein